MDRESSMLNRYKSCHGRDDCFFISTPPLKLLQLLSVSIDRGFVFPLGACYPFLIDPWQCCYNKHPIAACQISLLIFLNYFSISLNSIWYLYGTIKVYSSAISASIIFLFTKILSSKNTYLNNRLYASRSSCVSSFSKNIF